MGLYSYTVTLTRVLVEMQCLPQVPAPRHCQPHTQPGVSTSAHNHPHSAQSQRCSGRPAAVRCCAQYDPKQPCLALDRPVTHSYGGSAMRRSLLRWYLLHFLAGVFLLGAAAPTQLTLCVAAGGHAAVEPAQALCCHAAEPAAGADLRQQDVCGDDCVDTPLKTWLAARGPAAVANLAWTQHTPTSAVTACEPPVAVVHVCSASEAQFPTVFLPRSILTAVNLC